jgi:hypothetical protein
MVCVITDYNRKKSGKGALGEGLVRGSLHLIVYYSLLMEFGVVEN